MLAALVLALLLMLIWLAARYEASQVQSRLERDAAEAVGDIRAGLSHNLQSLQALQFHDPSPEVWAADAVALLRVQRELLRIEWRDSQHRESVHVDTPFHPSVFDRLGRDSVRSEVMQTCAAAQRVSGPSYSTSYFVPMRDGLGIEVMELCLPLVSAGIVKGFLVATYSLQDLLDGLARQFGATCRE